jgi:phosphoketolase
MQYIHLTTSQTNSQETNPFSHQRGCYIKTITARVQLKQSLIIGLNMLDAKMN